MSTEAFLEADREIVAAAHSLGKEPVGGTEYDHTSDWFLTATGLPFRPLDPIASQIRIFDIAHALSQICRFGGHCRTFYSVAQHSVLVSRIVPEEFALCGLLHDSTEAYIGDMVRPLKINMPEFQRAEAALWRQIRVVFNLPFDIPPEVKKADNIALMTERRDLMIHTPHKWSIQEDPLPYHIVAETSKEARDQFMARYFELEAKRGWTP